MIKKNKLKNKKRVGSYPFITVIFSITLALFVIGLCGLLLLQASRLSKNIQENLEIYVYLDKVENQMVHKLDSVLKNKEYVQIKNDTAGIKFLSKEISAQKFMAEAGHDFVSFLGDNPLRDMFVINLKSEYYVDSKLKLIKEDLQKIPGVFEVVYQENLIQDIQKNIQRISFVLIAFSVLLLITIAVLINNTIKLAMFSQRFLIRSMQLVGAKSSFIRKPFLLRAAIHGFLSGLIASGILLILIQYANMQIEKLELLQDPLSVLILLISLCISGAIIGLASAYFSVNRYLQMSLDELY